MIEHLRREFLSNWTPAGYRDFLDGMRRECGMAVPFRLCETPCFLPRNLLDRLDTAGRELIAQLSTPRYHTASERSLPRAFRVPAETPHPEFIQVDFGLTREADGGLGARLVEIQGFPSLYAFQPVLAQAYADAYGLDSSLQSLPSDLSARSYADLLRRTIVGGHDPADVVLMEIDPLRQKTRPDFILTERLCGIRTVCVGQIEKRGRRLFHRGRRIKRIYNRAIADEISRRTPRLQFDFRDELDVEWAGHPNYYFRISKFSLPFLAHPWVPRTLFLSDINEAPEDLDNWVLKPLYSFAGLGVVIGPSADEVDGVTDRENYVLQERINFTPVIDTPHGANKLELRLMYLWPRDGQLTLACTIARMGRGKMMGVDHNKNMEWVGASAALYAA